MHLPTDPHVPTGAPRRRAEDVPASGPRISLLGGFGLSDGRVDVAIAEGPQRLLAFLALRKDPVRRTLAAGALWPDADEEHAGSSLRSTLARLDEGARSALAVTASQLGIAERITVDLWESEALARRLEGPHESLTVHRSSSAEVDALSAELLPDWYEDWVIVEAEAAAAMRLRPWPTTCATTGRTRRPPPPRGLRETPRAALIRVHMAEGNVSDAIREFTRYRQLLQRELGLEPTPRLQALLDQDPLADRDR